MGGVFTSVFAGYQIYLLLHKGINNVDNFVSIFILENDASLQNILYVHITRVVIFYIH